MTKSSIIITATALLAGVSLALTLRPTGGKQIADLEERIRALEARLAERGPLPDSKAASRAKEPASLSVVSPARKGADAPTAPITKGAVNEEVMALLRYVEDNAAVRDEALADTIEEHVAEVIDVKVSELEEKQKIKESEDPSFADFASVLKLTDHQRDAAHSTIREGQVRTREILDIPTRDGRDLVQDLINAAAHEELEHPNTERLYMEWYWRVVSETIPGSNVTYGASIEGIKRDMLAGLRQDFTKEQFDEVKAWQLDPNRIEDLEDSPWADFDERVAKRVEALTEK